MAGTEQLLFRAMKAASDDRPQLGNSRRMLGVTIGPSDEFDVRPDANGMVAPGRGLSVALNDPRGLPKHRRPPAFGGEGRDPIFKLSSTAIPTTLSVHVDRAPHAVIGPAIVSRLEEYQGALATTRSSWEKI